MKSGTKPYPILASGKSSRQRISLESDTLIRHTSKRSFFPSSSRRLVFPCAGYLRCPFAKSVIFYTRML